MVTTTAREAVIAVIGNKNAKYVDVDEIGSYYYATVAVVQNVEERKNINGVWIGTGHIVTRATVYMDDGTYIRTKSKHVIATIGGLADDPVIVDNGFAVVINALVTFGKEPTVYANGKTYDVLTMTVGGE